MPKAQSSGQGGQSNQAPYQASHVLKRNQACHQCRRRKLEGVQLPPHPECTFDESEVLMPLALPHSLPGPFTTHTVTEAPPSEPTETPKNRFERLENRINELEAQLREKDRVLNGFSSEIPSSSSSPFSAPLSRPGGPSGLGVLSPFHTNGVMPPGDLNNLYGTLPTSKSMDAVGPLDFSTFPSGSSLDNLAGVASMLGNGSLADIHMNHTPDLGLNGMESSFAPGDRSLDLVFISWSPNLPDPEVTRHLVEAFFAFHLHAVKLFHGPSFLASLDLAPTHPRFPPAGILHAICAIGSLYTASIAPTPHPTEWNTYEVYGSNLRKSQRRPDSFAEQQVRFAKSELDNCIDTGMNPFQATQVSVMLTWWYWCHGRWAEAFLSAAETLRIAVPCGLNVCPPFHTISEILRPPAIIPPAKTVIEDEMRRNTFWVAYSMERQMGTGNGWASSLDDQDVCQLLPLRGDQFDQGVLVYPGERQWSHDRDVVAVHKDNQGKHYTGDASMISPNNSPAGDNPEYFDVKEAPAFIELDSLINSFKAAFPAHLKNPIDGQAVDQYLYTAWLIPALAQILLHEPHSRPDSDKCIHADKILRAARAIVELIYSISATSYDVSLLGLHAIMCWFAASRVLIRFLKAAMDATAEPQMVQLQAEIFFIRSMIDKAGERMFIAKRYKKMLDDFLMTTCGQKFMEPPSHMPSYSPPNDALPFDMSRATLDMFMQYKAPPMPPMPPSRKAQVAPPPP